MKQLMILFIACFVITTSCLANHDPVLNTDPPGIQLVTEGNNLSFTVQKSDIDGDSISLSHHPGSGYFPPGATFDNETGAFSWTPTFNDAGNYQFLVTATDGKGGKGYLYVDIKVQNVHVGDNEMPMLSPVGNRTIDEGTSLTIHIKATDSNQDLLIFSVNNSPTGSTFLSDKYGGHFRWHSDFSSSGEYNVDFGVSDGDLAITETIHITVNEINNNPSISFVPDSPPYILNEGETLQFTVQTTDPEGHEVTLKAFPNPPYGIPEGAVFNASTGEFTWTPSHNQAGSYRFYIIAEDGHNGWVREKIEITVNDFVNAPHVNPPPTLTNNPNLNLSGTKDSGTGIWVNGVERLAPTPSEEWTCIVPLVEGENPLSVTAKNSEGTESDPTIVTTMLDSIPPQITNQSPATHATISKPTISAEYNDGTGSGIKQESVKILFDNIDKTSEADFFTTGIAWIPTSDLDEGEHFVQVDVADVAGNNISEKWAFGIEFGDPLTSTGGTFCSADGRFCVEVPDGAMPLSENQAIAQEEEKIYVIPLDTDIFVPELSLPQDTDLQSAVMILPDDYAFLKPVTLTVTLDDYHVPGTLLTCMMLDENNQFTIDEGKKFVVNMDGKTATVIIEHFCVYGALKGLISTGAPLGGGVEIPLPDLFTGAFSHSLGIEVPPGRKNLQPSLQLLYRSNNRNSHTGFGWEMNPGFIERSTKKGVPKYIDPPTEDADSFVFSSTGSRMELVNLQENLYQSSIESGFVKFFKESDGSWRAVQKDGMQLFFGRTDASRIINSSGTFRWCLDRIEDPNGNYLEITYTNFGEGDIYLNTITYTGNVNTGFTPKHEIQFAWEDRNDDYYSYMSGYKISAIKRLQKIQTKVDGTNEWYYDFSYEYSAKTKRSLLKTVTRRARDGIPYPVQTFIYQEGGDLQ